MLQENGLPTLINSDGKFIQLEQYQEKWYNKGVDASKFAKVRGIISGEFFIHGVRVSLCSLPPVIKHALSK